MKRENQIMTGEDRQFIPRALPRKIAGISAVGLLVPAAASAALFVDVPSLSAGGRSALVTHFDGRFGVSVNGDGGVTAWEGRDGDGNTVITANRQGNNGFNIANSVRDESDSNTNITYNAARGSLTFTENNVYETAHLYAEMDGLLSGGTVTIFWKGSYSGSDPQGNQTLGRYAYNMTVGEINQVNGGMNHQRRNAGENVGAFFTGGGGTRLGDGIGSRNDVSTVYRSVYDITPTTASVDFFADGVDLNLADPSGGTIFGPGNEPNLYLGGFSYPIWYDTAGNQPGSGTNGGWSFIGEMDQLLIFEGTLSSSDTVAVEAFLGTIPEPSASLLLGMGAFALTVFRRRPQAR